MLNPYEIARSSAVTAAAVGRSIAERHQPGDQTAFNRTESGDRRHTPPSIASIDSVAILVGDSTTPNASVTHVEPQEILEPQQARIADAGREQRGADAVDRQALAPSGQGESGTAHAPGRQGDDRERDRQAGRDCGGAS